jgi:hypothetical protein
MTIDGHCPRCNPRVYQYQLPPIPVTQPPGCICPPTSEKTCESPTCPRKVSVRIGGYGATGGIDKPKTT